jgi:hypothetical protein
MNNLNIKIEPRGRWNRRVDGHPSCGPNLAKKRIVPERHERVALDFVIVPGIIL